MSPANQMNRNQQNQVPDAPPTDPNLVESGNGPNGAVDPLADIKELNEKLSAITSTNDGMSAALKDGAYGSKNGSAKKSHNQDVPPTQLDSAQMAAAMAAH